MRRDEHSTTPEEPLDPGTKWAPAWALGNMVRSFAKWMGVLSTIPHLESLADEPSNLRRTDDNSDECDQAFTEMAQEAGDTLVQMPSAAFIAENPEKRAAAKHR
jgi:hypothetical protein